MESEARLAVEEIGGKREEHELLVPSPISKMAPQAKGEGSGKKSNPPHGNKKPGNRKKEDERWNGYGNNKDWNTGMKQ